MLFPFLQNLCNLTCPYFLDVMFKVLQRKIFFAFELIIYFLKNFFQNNLRSFRSKFILEELMTNIKHYRQLLFLLRGNFDLYSIWNSMRLLPYLINYIFELFIGLLSYLVNLDELTIQL